MSRGNSSLRPITPNGMELVPLSWTEGEAVGSTLIDWRVRMLINDRLSMIQHYVPGGIETAVSAMMQEKFETFKCSFGSIGMDVPKLFLPIPDLPPGMDFPHAMVQDSKMVVTREELQAVFDDQVGKMCELIDKQLKTVKDNHPMESVSYLILSGGLGSSPYVQSRIRARYEGMGAASPGAKGIRVLLANEPQLTVVHGLVMSRIQSTRGGPEMYSTRMCPVSFGVICREVYNPKKHMGEDVSEDPYDKQKWAEKQINWIIKQGQVVRANTGASQSYRLKLDMGKEREPWRARIVMSTLPPDRLPSSLKRDGAREVAGIETILNPKDMKRKNRHWYNFGREFNRAEFELRVLDGMRSREHDEIEVDWQAVEDRLSQRNTNDRGLGIYRR
ncbi:uncharacterized protein LTR77_000194 [Saxophila tyrrhenica]|uniref:Actin-like ATPase domain-containing protein n=1 Tax=Saxophila tyrrhenica TaxID=1690608 RepID=A0AAV9PQ53_9PEZI|nr:hypothetical protein LTR77_000194 [Saxophila tyrrhenica]